MYVHTLHVCECTYVRMCGPSVKGIQRNAERGSYLNTEIILFRSLCGPYRQGTLYVCVHMYCTFTMVQLTTLLSEDTEKKFSVSSLLLVCQEICSRRRRNVHWKCVYVCVYGYPDLPHRISMLACLCSGVILG